MIAQIKLLVDSVKDDIIRWRRHIHQNPEVSFKEKETAAYIIKELSSLPNASIKQLTPTSVFVLIKGGKPGKRIAFRADIDALPINEQSGELFSSQNEGVMHACGHDSHTAMLMGIVKIVSKIAQEIKGEVVFLFQHAEELQPGGAIELIRNGALDKVSMIFGLHVMPDVPLGTVSYNKSVYCASADIFSITIKGKGAHGAYPQLSIDPIVIGSQVVGALQTIVSRRIGPALAPVVTIATFRAEGAYNIIADTAYLAGTWRSHNKEIRQEVPKLIEQTVKGITSAFGADYEFNIIKGGFPVGVNGKEAVSVVENVFNEYFSKDYILQENPPMFGAEDFSYYQEQVQGCYLFVGAGGQAGLHTSNFKLNEDAMSVGISIYAALIDYLLIK